MVDYYKKADESAAYYAASILDPTYKWSWFEERQGNDKDKKFWLEGNPKKKETSVKGLVRELQEEEYKNKYSLNLAPTPSSNSKDSLKLRDPNNLFGGLYKHKQLNSRI